MAALFFVIAVLALVCFLAAAFNVAARINLLALGLALFVLIWVITYGRALMH
jgi:hypothetical protein